MKDKSWLLLIVPVVVAGLFTALSFINVYQNFENRVFDLFLRIKPEIKEDSRILLLDIDDEAIDKVGVWPWSRHIMADGLILLREFGARSVVFDIEYTEESPQGVNSSVLTNEIPKAFQAEFSSIEENINALFTAVAEGSIPLSEAESFIGDLVGLAETSKEILLEKIKDIARDNDSYYGRAARLNGSTFFPVRMLPEEDPSESETLVEYALENFTLADPSVRNADIASAEAIKPSIYPIIKDAAGLGFPNVIVDTDGVRRRINLLMEYDGYYFKQLAFSPLMRWLGDPQVVIKPNEVILVDAEHPEKGKKNITIPLTENKEVLINWPHKIYEESFRHLTFYELVYNKEVEGRLVSNLNAMDEAGYLSYYSGDFGLLEPYRYAESIKDEVLNGGDPALMDDYAEARRVFFTELGSFLSGDAEARLLADIDNALNSGELDEETASFYQDIKAEVPEIFTPSRTLYDDLQKSRTRLSAGVNGSFIIVGWVGTSTTDIGVNPFAEKYMNVGTHASLVNTILQEEFLDEFPEWYSLVLAVLAAIVITLIIRKMDALPSILVGTAFVIVLIAASILVFVFTGLYFPPVAPVLAVFFTFVAITIAKFLQTAEERTFIRSAFGHYLSSDVINELLTDPQKLSLGGDKKYMTAMFTDVKGFSTISESLDPTELVSLLNEYLTDMSNIILEQRGTIDKYEGDAIISFFGAPIEYKDHAARACLSAVRMKKVEEKLNKKFLEQSLSPTPLYTRIGINTGEMVVGNMGTAQKMDYTIMGNSVNLAARLEGVNKQYGTWLLISETTYKDGAADMTVRMMDRVRVVGINEPVRLYELVDEKSATPDLVREALDIFHNGIEEFEKKNWQAALGLFNKVIEIMPEDGPSNVYIKRCKDFIKKEPPASWDGVFNLTLK